MGLFRNIGALATGALACGPALAQADDPPLVMEPSSQWVADYAEDYCALRRAFAAEGQRAILELRQYAPGERFEVIVVSDTVAATRTVPKVRFVPDDAWSDVSDVAYVDSGAQHGVLYEDDLHPPALAPAEPLNIVSNGDGANLAPQPAPEWPASERDAREASVTALTVANSFARPLTLKTGRLHAPMEALRTCMDELLTHWGVDPVALRTASHPTNSGWLSRIVENYPPEMIRQGKGGRVQIRIIIGKDGRPTACIPVKGRADPAFEKAACDGAMRYSRFQPTVDASGQPIANFFSTTVFYQLSR